MKATIHVHAIGPGILAEINASHLLDALSEMLISESDVTTLTVTDPMRGTARWQVEPR